MPRLFDVVYACECTSTHHKLALDAVRHLRCPNADKWQEVFVHYFDAYLDGAKAPDKKFKDFRNHVVHVDEDNWGGAVEAARPWFDKTVHLLQSKRWSQAVYAAGVLSHYYTDPIQPLHTAQSETEGKVHRAIEWSIAKSYDELYAILINDLGGLPDVPAPSSDDWLAEMIVAGAQFAHPYYDLLIDHYDLERGRRDPPSGLDQESKDCLARLIGYASAGFARILERAFEEAAVDPPNVHNGLLGYLAQLTVPFTWVTRKLADRRDRAAVQAIYAEVEKTGRAVRSLPSDDKAIRELHAKEVLNRSLEELAEQPVRETGTQFGAGAPARSGRRQRTAPRPRRPDRTPPAKADAARRRQKQKRPSADKGGEGVRRVAEPTAVDADIRVDAAHETPPGLQYYLELTDAVADAPSIGSKTARRLAAVGVRTVADLLEADADQTAGLLRHGYIDADAVRRWQAEAKLALCVPNLRGHDAQLLVGCELQDPEEIALFDPNELLDLVLPFAASEQGQRILRSSGGPDLSEVSDWIEWAGQARRLDAA